MRSSSFLTAFVAALAPTKWAQAAITESARADYERFCRACHSESFRLPSGAPPSLIPERWGEAIRDGIEARGMPAFGAQLSETRVSELVRFIRDSRREEPRKLGSTIEGEALHPGHSANYVVMRAESAPDTQFIGFFSERSFLCYENVDLTGVRSLELDYAKGNEDPGRIAILAGDGVNSPRINLGEKSAVPTGGWETFQRHRVGLAREMRGAQLLCIYGMAGGGILNLDRFTLSREAGEHDGLTLAAAPETAQPTFSAAGHEFGLERVASVSSDLWGMAFLPDGRLLVTQKNGQLLVFRDEKPLGAVTGTPPVWSGGQGGMMDVKPHPGYRDNGWIYLTFSDPGPDNTTSMTRVVRGKLDGLRWVQQQDIWRAPDRFYTANYAHFGSRLAFLDGYLYFSVGERQQPALAQDLSAPFGKVHRLHDDGRVPADNPFVRRDGALPSIYSYGHRNPQGMTVQGRHVWVAEHGPKGGDELNLLRPGANYGWPLVSFGTHYDGKPVGDSPYADGVEPPVHHWTPSIAVAQIAFCSGDAFPAWQGQLLVTSLGQEQLRLVALRGERVLNDQLLFQGQGRIRDVAVGPDGYIYLLINRFGAGIHRLVPR